MSECFLAADNLLNGDGANCSEAAVADEDAVNSGFGALLTSRCAVKFHELIEDRSASGAAPAGVE